MSQRERADWDVENGGRPLGPYIGPSVTTAQRDGSQTEGSDPPHSPSSGPSQTFSSTAGYTNGEPPVSFANRSSSNGHTSHSGHEPLMQPRSSRSYSPPAYSLLTGTFQRRETPRRTSLEGNYAPPVPPLHILTSFAPPQQLHNRAATPDSEYSQPDGLESEEAHSPLDPQLGLRLRGNDNSLASVGLRDHEDYSARPRLEVRHIVCLVDKPSRF